MFPMREARRRVEVNLATANDASDKEKPEGPCGEAISRKRERREA